MNEDIAYLLQSGQEPQALAFFEQMSDEGLFPGTLHPIYIYIYMIPKRERERERKQ